MFQRLFRDVQRCFGYFQRLSRVFQRVFKYFQSFFQRCFKDFALFSGPTQWLLFPPFLFWLFDEDVNYRICVLTWGAKFRLSSSCFGDLLNTFQSVSRVFSEIFRIPRPDPVANIPSVFSRFPIIMWIDRFLCSLAVTNEVVAVLCKRSQLLMCDIGAGQKECARVTWRCW